MKIKKKDYYKELNNAYWNGVKAGINYTLQNPKEAEQYKDNIEPLKLKAATAVKVVNKVVNEFSDKFSELFRKVEE